jgi:hypothetical protein
LARPNDHACDDRNDKCDAAEERKPDEERRQRDNPDGQHHADASRNPNQIVSMICLSPAEE